MITVHDFKRMTQVGRRVWNALTNDEREAWYCDTGTYGFIECVADILHIDLSKWTTEDMEYVEARVCK